MRYLAILFLLPAFFFFGCSASEASWLIDIERLSSSGHGEFSCIECHDDITDGKPHPDPAAVNKTLEDFFSIERCMECHDEVEEEISSDLHGGLTATRPGEFESCLECHHPHYADQYTPDAVERMIASGKQPSKKPDQDSKRPETVTIEISEDDRRCLACHQLIVSDDAKSRKALSDLCLYCHGLTGFQAKTDLQVLPPALDTDRLKSSSHTSLSCLECHPKAAGYLHAEQPRRDCRSCHYPHAAAVAGDVHLNLDCEACHLKNVHLARDPESGRVTAKYDREQHQISTIHDMVMAKEERECGRCHNVENTIGAAAMILPAKSVICMPCHAATFSAEDSISIVSLIVFFIGLLFLASVWLPGDTKIGTVIKLTIKVLFSSRIFLVLKALVLDVLLNRRLFNQSVTRWLIHSLIFLPFVFRFLWGLAGLATSQYFPQWQFTWILMDRNHPVTAFLFDITGILVILGVCLALIRNAKGTTEKIPGLPKQDLPALILIGGIIIVGFVLEAMRIGMTQRPAGAEFAFIGYILSNLFTGSTSLHVAYIYVWYAHALFTGAFIAYLPFSRMLHIFTAPLVMMINAVRKDDKLLHSKEGILH